jgi:hypothetical protein
VSNVGFTPLFCFDPSQVRAYFYRLLKKIKKLLKPLGFTFDNRDRIDCLIVLLSFWEAKTQTDFDEISNPFDFANAVKERIIKYDFSVVSSVELSLLYVKTKRNTED